MPLSNLSSGKHYPMLIFFASFLFVVWVSEDVDSTIVGFLGVNDAFFEPVI